jgi:Toprim domain
VHLTLLRPDGSDKAEIEPNKITVGSPCGMPLVLAPMNDLMGLAISEGIENALSMHQGTGLGAWAAGSAPYLPGLVTAVENLTRREYDASPNCITIIVDDDEAGRKGSAALATALTELSARLSPEPPHHFEILLKEGAQ